LIKIKERLEQTKEILDRADKHYQK
jgi:hypothetical protein